MGSSAHQSAAASQRVRAASCRGFYVLMLFACGLLLSACVTIPIQEMSDARQAITSAEDADAALCAPTSFARAEALLHQAQTSLNAQDYGAARAQALAAKQVAWQARSLARSIRQVEQKLDEASRVGADAAAASILLEQARSVGVSGDEERATMISEAADQAIDSALSTAYREHSQTLIAQISTRESGLTLSQQSSLQAARTALRRGELERAFELSRNLAIELGLWSGAG